jgi:hypothetical protein
MYAIRKALFILIATTVLCFSCGDSNINGYNLSTNLYNCTSISQSVDLKNFKNTAVEFAVDLPSTWLVEKNDTGIIAIDTVALLNNNIVNTVSIIVIDSPVPLKTQFQHDLSELEKENKILEVGTYSLNNNSYWILAEDVYESQPLLNLLIYTKLPSSDKLYLLHFSFTKVNNYMDKICSFKNIFDSFKVQSF